MNPIATVLWLALLVGCALAKSAVDVKDIHDISFKIVGGKDAEKGQFPHQVSMRSSLNNAHFCGGSIISTRFILTAAHCCQAQNAKPDRVYVIVGALHRLSGGVKMALEKIIAHQQYSQRTIKNDISLLQTKDEIVYSEFVRPIPLPTELPTVGGDLAVTLSGWGRNTFPTPPGASALPDILQFAPAATLSFAKCKQRFQLTPAYIFLSETNLCTTNPKGRGACHGDSGGPLISVKEKALVGIVSWGVPCAQGFPDVYTNVYLYRDWIHGEVAKLGGSIPSEPE